MTGTLRLAAKLPRPEAWINDAPCAAGSPYDHDLPPEVGGKRDMAARALMYPRVTDALKRCSTCRYIAECLARVDPVESGYDGICGGILWVNGEARGGLTSSMGGAA